MVSFSCEACGDVVTKPKLVKHKNKCHADVTCLDCNKTFRGNEHAGHTSCISEAQKFQKSVYQGEKSSKKKGKQDKQAAAKPAEPMEVDAPAVESAAIPLPTLAPMPAPDSEKSLKRKAETGESAGDPAQAKTDKKKRKKEKKADANKVNGEEAAAVQPDEPVVNGDIPATTIEQAIAVTLPAAEKPKKAKKQKKSKGEEVAEAKLASVNTPAEATTNTPAEVPEAGPVTTTADLETPELLSRIKTTIKNTFVVHGVSKSLAQILEIVKKDPYVVGTDAEIEQAFMKVQLKKSKELNMML